MKTIRQDVAFDELLIAWADSESGRFGYSKHTDLLRLCALHLLNRAPIYADILNAGVRKISLVEIGQADVASIKLLRQQNRNRRLEAPMSPRRYAKQCAEKSHNETWSFIAIRRGRRLTVVDGLHRLSSWINAGSKGRIRGYIVTTARRLPRFSP